jgi:hypothetical protein
MTHGVIGNTSDFGSEESRFETWWVNYINGANSDIMTECAFLFYVLLKHY